MITTVLAKQNHDILDLPVAVSYVQIVKVFSSIGQVTGQSDQLKLQMPIVIIEMI